MRKQAIFMKANGRLADKVAIVTGASRGVGLGEALALSAEGAAVGLIATTEDDLARAAKEIEQRGGRALPIVADVSQRDQVDAAVQATIEAFGQVDVLVNNAQRIPDQHPFETWTEDELRATFDSGFMGTWNFMQAVFPHMKERQHGRIINTCSVVGTASWPGFAGYAATKEAIRALTRTVSQEWGTYGITVNVISPAVVSDAMDMLYPEGPAREAILAQFALRRFGDAQSDVGAAVVYLAAEGGYVTGCTLSVDGGSNPLV
jgi:NAD(P)-dependent dehydrogenase (short-subunit alcohol dehydrogenase family)